MWQGDWTKIPMGLPGVETLVPLVYTHGVLKKRITMNELVEKCNVLIHIPANADYSSLNLAQAVQVLAYECRLACASPAPAVSAIGFQGEPAGVDRGGRFPGASGRPVRWAEERPTVREAGRGSGHVRRVQAPPRRGRHRQ